MLLNQLSLQIVEKVDLMNSKPEYGLSIYISDNSEFRLLLRILNKASQLCLEKSE